MGICCSDGSASTVGPEEVDLSDDSPWVRSGISQGCYEGLLKEFVTLDLNGDHKLSRSEFDNLGRLPEHLGMKANDITHLFNSVDVNHDNSISLKEFVTYMTKRKDHLPLPVQVSPQRERLEDKMVKYGFELCTTDGGRRGVMGDGNCQFYSLSWGLHQTTARQAEIRKGVVEYLRGAGREDYEVFYAPTHPSQPATFDGYLDEMGRDCVWGDHLTLQAAANIYKMEVRVFTCEKFTDTSSPLLVVSPQREAAGARIWMSFAAQHYSPIKPTSRTPADLLPQ